jgi:FkbM family methyltransferase
LGALGRLRYARRYRNWREIMRTQEAGAKPSCVVLRDGTVFEAPPGVNPASAASAIWFRRCYEPPGFALRAGDVVIDVGASVGVFALLAERSGAARVLALEPHPENAAFLARNLAANRANRVEVVQCALADRAGTARLHVAAKGVAHRLFDRDEDGATLAEFLEVPADTLSGLCRTHGIGRIDFLKLDCEGAEGLILGSAGPETLASVDRISLEFHDEVSPLGHEELRRVLDRAGFETRIAWDGRSSRGFLYARVPPARTPSPGRPS